MLTILMWIGIGYLFWMISGYINFRIVNKVQKGRYLLSNHFWSEYCTTAKTYWHLTPKVGLMYTLVYGFGGLVICSIIMISRGIGKAYNRQFANGFDKSIGANRFFGIK